MKTLIAISLLLCALGACGGDGVVVDEVVGATCIDDRDCAELCERGGEFPGGFCTLSCRDDLDCPSDTLCAGVRGNICMYQCEIDIDCDFLGRNYFCVDEPDFAGRLVGVCMGD